MRFYDNGSGYSVTVTRREVEDFVSRWPCCSLPRRAITFCFDKSNGDLVDILPESISHKVDGPESLALSQDAQAYGVKRLRAARGESNA